MSFLNPESFDIFQETSGKEQSHHKNQKSRIFDILRNNSNEKNSLKNDTSSNLKNSNDYDIFKGKKIDKIDAITSIRQKRKEKISKEKGFQIFSKQSEVDYINEIEGNVILLSKLPETLENANFFSHNLKRKYKLKIEEIDKLSQRKDELIQFYLNQLENLQKDFLDYKEQSSIEIERINRQKEIIKIDNKSREVEISKKDKIFRDMKLKCEIQTNEILKNGEAIKKASDQRNEENEYKKCCICTMKPSTHLCVPCGHKKYCADCIDKINTCSLCNKYIFHKIKIFE